jgi:predicted ATPase/class 3 adenylate cyclase
VYVSPTLAWKTGGVGAPSGTVTFLFTDVEGSTRLWETAPSAMAAAVKRHDDLLRSAADAHRGYVFSTGGDGFAVAFARAGDAIGAATDAQAALRAEPWPEGAVIRVRMGLHSGEVVERDGDYFGPAVNRSARLTELGHGGQVLCSAVTAGLVGDGWALRDLGEHRLRDLSAHQRVFQVGAEQFPPLRSLDRLGGNLPIQANSFVGREAEVAEVVKTILAVRLVTLTGPGGVGKTRLALQAAADVAVGFDDGVCLVELAGLASGSEVPAAVAAVLEVAQQAGRSLWGSVCDACRYRHLLLVLDNAEHVLDDVADLTVELLGAAPGVKVLVTSREALTVASEQIRPVRPLGVEDEAVALFADRARAVQPGFEITADNEAAVVDVCRHLDGMPLAIELAAARVGSMSPAEIAGRLDQRFRLLRAGRRTRVERHQTLRAAIDWSYDALSEGDQQVFAQLAVFSASFTASAAQIVVGGDGQRDAWDVLESLDSLVAKSLLTSADHEGVTRYQMLETVRHYANERLAEKGGIEDLRAGHARWVADYVETDAGPGLKGPDENLWTRVLEAERDNIATAIEWSVTTQDLETAMRITAALGVPAVDKHRLGLTDLPALVLNMGGAMEHPLYPQVAGAASFVLLQRGELQEAVALSRASVAASGAGEQRSVLALGALCLALLYLGDSEGAARIAEETLALAEASEDPWVRAVLTTAAVGMLYNSRSRPADELSAMATTTLELARDLANPTALRMVAFEAGVLQSASDPAGAVAFYHEALQAASGAGAGLTSYSAIQGFLAKACAALGDRPQTITAIRQGVLFARDAGSPALLAQILDHGGQALIALGQYEQGATLAAAAVSGRISHRIMTGRILEQRTVDQNAACAGLGQESYDHAVKLGNSLGFDSAIDYTLTALDKLDQSSF